MREVYRDEFCSVCADARDENCGNASHFYQLFFANTEMWLPFQHGLVKENGVNGITNEMLIAIVIDRLEGFQAGKYACSHNKAALESLKDALAFLELRTKERQIRGVEGTDEL